MPTADRDEKMRARFMALVEAGRWAEAITLAIGEGGLDAREIGRETETSGGTVRRCASGQTAPHPSSMPHMAARIAAMFRLRSMPRSANGAPRPFH